MEISLPADIAFRGTC